MNLDNEKIAELKHLFNVNMYEAKLWFSLLSKGTASASELSEVSNVPRSRAYDVLESLEKRGFVNAKLGKPIKYIAVPPEEVISIVKKEIESERDLRLTSMLSISEKESFRMLKEAYDNSGSDISSLQAPTAVKGRNNIYARISNMISKANRNVLVVTDEKGAFRKTYEFEEALRKARDNGAKLKMVSRFSKKDDRMKKLKELFEVKEAKNVDMRFVLIDDTIALFTSNGEDVHPNNDTCVLIKSPYLEEAFKRIFW